MPSNTQVFQFCLKMAGKNALDSVEQIQYAKLTQKESRGSLGIKLMSSQLTLMHLKYMAVIWNTVDVLEHSMVRFFLKLCDFV